jgi:hypothetical protein
MFAICENVAMNQSYATNELASLRENCQFIYRVFRRKNNKNNVATIIYSFFQKKQDSLYSMYRILNHNM